MNVYGIIYLIRNTLNGKVYIGQTTKTLERRWKEHNWSSRYKSPLKAALRKYGATAFTASVLHQAFSRQELDEMEVCAIWSHDSTNRSSGYNLTPGGKSLGKGSQHPSFGREVSQETRLKISAANKGHETSPEHRRKIGIKSVGRIHNRGRVHKSSDIKLCVESRRINPTYNRTGFKGVAFDEKYQNKYCVRFRHEGKRLYLGRFSTAEEAARAYNIKIRELQGKSAFINLLPSGNKYITWFDVQIGSLN